jgi:hypothetical protein
MGNISFKRRYTAMRLCPPPTPAGTCRCHEHLQNEPQTGRAHQGPPCHAPILTRACCPTSLSSACPRWPGRRSEHHMRLRTRAKQGGEEVAKPLAMDIFLGERRETRRGLEKATLTEAGRSWLPSKTRPTKSPTGHDAVLHPLSKGSAPGRAPRLLESLPRSRQIKRGQAPST